LKSFKPFDLVLTNAYISFKTLYKSGSDLVQQKAINQLEYVGTLCGYIMWVHYVGTLCGYILCGYIMRVHYVGIYYVGMLFYLGVHNYCLTTSGRFLLFCRIINLRTDFFDPTYMWYHCDHSKLKLEYKLIRMYHIMYH